MIRCVRVWAVYCGEDDCNASVAGPAPLNPDHMSSTIADLFAAVQLQEPGWVFGPRDAARCPVHAPVAPFAPVAWTTVPDERALALQVR